MGSRSPGHARLLEAEPNLLLGLDAHTTRVDHELHLDAGETLVLYTDGLVERRDAGLSQGLDWLVSALQGTQDRSVEELADDLVEQVLGAEDDVALLLVRNETAAALPRSVVEGRQIGVPED